MPILEVFNSYAHMSIAAGPQTGIVLNEHVELDTLGFIGTEIDGTDVELSTGVGQANGNITLKNRRYLVRVEIWGKTDEGTLLTQLFNFAGTVATLDESGVGVVPWSYINDSNANDQSMPTAIYLLVDATGGDVEFMLKFQAINTIVTNVDARVYAFPLDAVDGGATFDSWAKIYVGPGNQSSNLNVNDHVEFNNIARIGTVADASAVALATGVGQANGIVTLSGYRFLVITMIGGQCNEGRGNFFWTDTGGVEIPNELGTNPKPVWLSFADNNQSDTANQPSSAWSIYDARSSDIEMELRIWDEVNLVFMYNTCCVLFIPIMEAA
jgi:hypothetical protein